jgi:hypothetical protein
MQTIWLNVAPTAIENIQWKFYLVFVILGVCGPFHVYFFIPEVSQRPSLRASLIIDDLQTKNIPLEELDGLFGRNVAVHLNDIEDNMAVKEQGISATRLEDVNHCGKELA